MSNLPQVKEENIPPRLRFVPFAMEDRRKSEQTGKMEYMNAIKVYIRAAGDGKTEVPDIAMKTKYEVSTATEEVEEERTHFVKKADGTAEEVTEMVKVPYEKVFLKPYTAYPWLEKLKNHLKNGRITKEYYEHCEKSFNAFMKNQELPVEGTPLSEWTGATEAQKRKAIEIGINSVELCAEMTEEAIQAIGMGARDMKNKARAYVDRDREPEKFANEMVNLREKNDFQQDQISSLQRKLQELQSRSEQSEKEGLDDLRAQYKEQTGEEPDKRWGERKLREKLEKSAA